MDQSAKWDQAKLRGIVEGDEAFIGGKPKYQKGVKRKRGKGTDNPQIIVVVRRDGEARAAMIADGTAKAIGRKVRDWIDPSATLMTDSFSVYPSIGRGFTQRYAVNHSQKQFADKTTGAHQYGGSLHGPRSSARASASITSFRRSTSTDISPRSPGDGSGASRLASYSTPGAPPDGAIASGSPSRSSPG